MKLVDMGLLKVDDKMSKYLPYLKETDKAHITVKQVMSHCARLRASYPFWESASGYDSVLLHVSQLPLSENEGMVYSDLGFMLLSDVVKRIMGKPLDVFVAEQFYRPMGLNSTCFKPKQQTAAYLQRVAPTEQDDRRGLICGDVHDPNAFAMGGVSGHAGLFSTANEVAQIMQMLLNGGEYKGVRYLKRKTIEKFTSRHYARQGNRRALGFDKPLLSPSKNGQTAMEATPESYGHTGFTGTMVWVEPKYDLVYVFLSNRVHPTASPNRLAQMNIRTDVQSVLYNILQQ